MLGRARGVRFVGFVPALMLCRVTARRGSWVPGSARSRVSNTGGA